MKGLVFVLFVMAAFLAEQAVAYDYLEKCVKCFLYSSFEPACGKHRGTYWNRCALDCDNATFLHSGFCTIEDLLENDLREHPYYH